MAPAPFSARACGSGGAVPRSIFTRYVNCSVRTPTPLRAGSADARASSIAPRSGSSSHRAYMLYRCPLHLSAPSLVLPRAHGGVWGARTHIAGSWRGKADLRKTPRSLCAPLESAVCSVVWPRNARQMSRDASRSVVRSSICERQTGRKVSARRPVSCDNRFFGRAFPRSAISEGA